MSSNEGKFKVAVVGAGASGLAAVKCCLDEGLEPTCFEKSQDIGGLWRYTEKAEQGKAGVYHTTTINTSKELLAYSTFPPPADFPNFMHHSKLHEYMKLYAKNYNLCNYIKLNTEVVSVKKSDSFQITGKWVVTTKGADGNGQDTMVVTDTFDAVMVCTGHHAYPNNPAEKIPGCRKFKGRVFHVHEYRNHKPFEGRQVMVVGLGNTGGDLAAELSRHASKLCLSTRRGAWVINRIANKGIPYDCEVVTRLASYLMDIAPYSVSNWFYEKKMNDRFDHELYGLKPKHRITGQHPLVNDELPARIANGTVTVVSDVTKFTENGIITSDGILREVDDVIFATGYYMKFPFLPDDVVAVDERNTPSPLYKHVFPLSLTTNPTLALIGNVQPLGGLMPIAEMQSRWACMIFKGSANLPPLRIMQKEVETRKEYLQKRYVKSARHTIQVDYTKYMDSVAKEIKVQPDLIRLLIDDPSLAWKVLTGPATSYQYRLFGHGSWKGAPNAIATQWQRIRAGFGHKVESQICKGDEQFSNPFVAFSNSVNPAKLLHQSSAMKPSESKIINFLVLVLILMSVVTLVLAQSF